MEKLVKFLQDRITDKTPLEGIVDAFEQMCRIPLDDDMILFETGTYSFTGERRFYFSLVRQTQNEDQAYFQLHVDVLYQPTKANKAFRETTWDEDLSESIFDYIRQSPVFAFCKDKEYAKVDIHLEEI